MMTMEDADRLMALMHRHGIGAFRYSGHGADVHLVATLAEGLRAGKSRPGASVVASPGIGRFRPVHPASQGTTAVLPRRVKKDDIVAYLAVGPMLRPVLAGRDGILQTVLKQDGDLTGFGDPLFSF